MNPWIPVVLVAIEAAKALVEACRDASPRS